ncbi:MAG: LPS export ABC transporter periplasmic protein LptC [Proteobacteria bacterium]|nr:MAG: LPS export ABC transporter periplasmic protein LptC [Pseudomonadota bacterium]
MIKRRNLLWIIPLFLMATFPLWKIPIAAFLQPRGGYAPSFGNKDKRTHDFLLKDIVIIQDQNGKKTAVIRADNAHTTKTPNVFVLHRIDADLYSTKDGIVHVVAKRGTYNTNTKMLVLEEQVTLVRSSDNQKLFTEKLIYDDQKRTIHSPVKTKLVGNNIVIDGKSLDYNVTTSQYIIGGKLLCTIQDFGQD